ncbi:MAG: DUF4421 family protein [Bacteroidaceae bacterium]|nr:DUF4421 family protein [Bacteroidaceae bacterium]
MKKFILLLFSIFITINIPAQDKKSAFSNILDRLSETKADTSYVSCSTYPFSIKTRITTIINSSQLNWPETKNSLSLLAQPTFKIGFHVSYRGIGFGFQKDVIELLGKGKNSNIEISANAYGRKFGGDISYSTSSNYSINKLNGVLCNKDVEGVESKRIYANMYYVFNNKKFSYPAALTQSYIQKRNCGSVIAGLSVYYNSLETTPTELSLTTNNIIPAIDIMQHSQYYSLNFNVGYAYNWVLNRQWMIHCTALPSFSFINELKYKLQDCTQHKRNSFNFAGIARLGVLWNYKRYYAGFTALTYVFETKYNSMSMIDMHTKAQIAFGVRF